MQRGSKDSYTDKQKRQAEHIEEGYLEKGVSRDEAEARAWATVNKNDGGGKLSGSGRKRSGSADKKESSTKKSGIKNKKD
jgi:plasmid stabilization system protein ParE